MPIYSSTKPSYINLEDDIDSVDDVLKEIENQKQGDKEMYRQELISNFKKNKHKIESDGCIEVFRHGTSKTYDLAKKLFIPKGWEVYLQEDSDIKDNGYNWKDVNEKGVDWFNSRIILKIPSLKNKIVSVYNDFIKENGPSSFHENAEIIVYECELNHNSTNKERAEKEKEFQKAIEVSNDYFEGMIIIPQVWWHKPKSRGKYKWVTLKDGMKYDRARIIVKAREIQEKDLYEKIFDVTIRSNLSTGIIYEYKLDDDSSNKERVEKEKEFQEAIKSAHKLYDNTLNVIVEAYWAKPGTLSLKEWVPLKDDMKYDKARIRVEPKTKKRTNDHNDNNQKHKKKKL